MGDGGWRVTAHAAGRAAPKQCWDGPGLGRGTLETPQEGAVLIQPAHGEGWLHAQLQGPCGSVDSKASVCSWGE